MAVALNPIQMTLGESIASTMISAILILPLIVTKDA
jgi:hypothetical protein